MRRPRRRSGRQERRSRPGSRSRRHFLLWRAARTPVLLALADPPGSLGGRLGYRWRVGVMLDAKSLGVAAVAADVHRPDRRVVQADEFGQPFALVLRADVGALGGGLGGGPAAV